MKILKNIFFEEYNKIKDDASLNLVIVPVVNEAKATNLPVVEVKTPEFELWKKRFVNEQKQKGLFSIKLPLKLGDIEHEDVNRLCAFLENFGDNTIRCSRSQNIQLRNIPEKYLG
jgi:sulfite reductase (ferredoxin)